jgi:hypothetical protein
LPSLHENPLTLVSTSSTLFWPKVLQLLMP